MTPAQINRDAFLQTLQQSGLLSPADFDVTLERLGEIDKPRALARVLVDWGVLTKFQAELLLIGRARGFFLGPYKILDQLGQGGMGRVYKALHQTMNRIVALKVLAPQLVKTPKAQKLFQREVQAAAQLNHPNIVTAYDANEVGGRHYLAMEFVDGPTLEQLVREQGPLPVGMACEIIRQTGNGLQHAHDNDMIHRDIKPANMLIQPSKNLQSFVVKILDFGLAHLNDPSMQDALPPIELKENNVMGTPDFLSPEQAHNMHQVDIRADIYSLGCTFYFLLTGKLPFPGGNTFEKLLRHSKEDPIDIGELRPDLPVAVRAILKLMMAKNPEERYQTPETLASALLPHAFACAPNWDRTPKDAQAELTTNTPSLKDDAASSKPASGDMVGTLPPGLEPTTFSNPAEGQFLPWDENDQDHRRQKRQALLWSLGIVAALGLLLASVFLLLNQ